MKIRILVMANSMVYQNQASGGDRLFVELSKHLNSDKYKIDVITTAIGEKVWADGRKEEIIKLPESVFDQHPRRIFVPFLYTMRAIHASRIPIVEGEDSFIVYTSSDSICDTLPALWIKKRSRKAALWVARIYHVIPPPTRRRGNFILNTLSFLGQRFSFWLIKWRADLIIALNQALFDELISLGFPEKKMTISGGGIDLKRIDSISAPPTRYEGIFLGRLHPNKGVYDLIDIWKLVTDKYPNAKLAIIGGGDAGIIASVRKRIANYNLGGNIDLIGFLPHDKDVYRVLKSSKIFLFTDHENGWSLATCEAMACGLPVIAYNLEIFGTVFQQGFVTVPLYDVSEYARKVIAFLADDRARLKLAEEARQQAKEFSWEKTAKEVSILIKKLLFLRN